MTKNKRLAASLFLGVLLMSILLGIVFLRTSRVAAPAVVSTAPQPVAVTVTSTGVWEALLEVTPYPYFTPLPEAVRSPIDGTYAKLDQSPPQWWKCLRCADYRPVGGIWKLQFDRGVMRILYEVNKWRSIASYSVSGDRLFIFNDPYCPEHTGEYGWRLDGEGLELEAVHDECSFDLRAKNLSRQSWLSCGEADSSAGEHPPGCEAVQSPVPASVQPQPPLRVTVHGGDSRFFETPPEIIAHANTADVQPPQGIRISYAAESIPFGLQRVLWWEGGWIEVAFDGPYASMGVQFMGEEPIGWARVLFDGQEVWRGKTSDIWSRYGRHGGFVEVTGFRLGEHILRVESMGFDYRPVTVAGFGFRREGGVHP